MTLPVLVSLKTRRMINKQILASATEANNYQNNVKADVCEFTCGTFTLCHMIRSGQKIWDNHDLINQVVRIRIPSSQAWHASGQEGEIIKLQDSGSRKVKLMEGSQKYVFWGTYTLDTRLDMARLHSKMVHMDRTKQSSLMPQLLSCISGELWKF